MLAAAILAGKAARLRTQKKEEHIMRAVAFNGSPRTNGNTHAMIQRIFEKLIQHDVACVEYQVGGKRIGGCRACGSCKKVQNRACIYDDDCINEALALMEEADIIILGSPTYFAALTPEMKALIDRCGYVSRANGGMLRRKIGASLTAVRRAGALNVFQAMNNFFFINEMIVPGSSYWNLAIARDIGAFAADDEGVATMDTLAENIIWLADRIIG